jgi:hypothetical protein
MPARHAGSPQDESVPVADWKPVPPLFVQRPAAKRHHHPGKSGQRHRDLSGGRESFTRFHRFGLDIGFRRREQTRNLGSGNVFDWERTRPRVLAIVPRDRESLLFAFIAQVIRDFGSDDIPAASVDRFSDLTFQRTRKRISDRFCVLRISRDTECGYRYISLFGGCLRLV